MTTPSPKPSTHRADAVTVGLLAAVAVLWAQPAHAYIDAGTGGLLVQLLLAGIAGAGVLLRMYWQKLKAIFVRRDD